MNANDLQKIKELRHQLHRNPERSLCEKNTMALLKDFLHENTSFETIDREGWFYAVKPGTGPKAPLAFRAETDALPMEEGIGLPYASENPGTAHKCGHDGHMAALCGLALELDRADAGRTVYLIFQPAEEIGQGGEACAKLIREKGIREVYAFHNRSGFPEKSIVYRRGLTQPASEGLIIRLLGKTSHASEPEEGKNPSAAIAELGLYSQRSAARMKNGLAMCTIVGMKSGTDDFGISAGEGYICFTLRAEEESVMDQMEQDLRRAAGELAERDGLRAGFKIRDYFPETRNHDSAVDRVISAAQTLGLQTIEVPDVWRGSEDFGYFLKECPGAIFYIGNGENYPAIHTQPYDFNDGILETAVDMFKTLACADVTEALRALRGQGSGSRE
ncbi:MAG: amidohydrolase [Flexilinea sp.]|nr:amidohydrolase [Flexilinea sp.]